MTLRVLLMLIAEARDLRSESGENTEYDRALFELTARVFGFGQDDPEWTLLRRAILS